MTVDETLLWRPRPTSPYAYTGKLLVVTSAALSKTASTLENAGEVESACLWLGPMDETGNARVAAVVVPKQTNRARNYLVPGEAMLEVSALARMHGWTVVAAIHSHPGSGVEHSTYDDQMTPSRRAISIVFPNYGNWRNTWPFGLGVHEYSDKYWHMLHPVDVQARVRLNDSDGVQIMDLR